MLNGQSSSWWWCCSSKKIYSRSIIILNHVDDLSDNLSSNTKPFANDTSIFSAVYDVNTSAKELTDDLKKVGFPIKNKFQSRFEQTN